MEKSKMKKKRICVVTGSRADYGHLLSVMRNLSDDPNVQLQVVVTGSHLAREQGYTYRQIKSDGFRIDAKVNILRFDDSEQGITKRIGSGCQGFADAFHRLKPDIVVVLGDRYEILAATIAAYVANIPVAHIHGGESSEGAIDEGFRHAITKMAYVHFPATEIYRNRIIQLGEQPKNVFNFGAPCLDAIKEIRFLSKAELARILNFDLSGRVAIVTFHPITLEPAVSIKQLKNILAAIRIFDLKALFTKGNMDPQGRKINETLARFCRKFPGRYRLVDNLGKQKYWSCLCCFDVMIGNSSSGFVEAPSFALPVVNVGDRQRGRIRAPNIIDASYAVDDIRKAIAKALSPAFLNSLRGMRNPYGSYGGGQTGRRIKEKLKSIKLNGATFKKEFFDLGVSARKKVRSYA